MALVVEELGTMVLLAKIDLTALAEEFAKQVLKCLQYVCVVKCSNKSMK